jgi:outer membrane receptor protein involved in Fe transport
MHRPCAAALGCALLVHATVARSQPAPPSAPPAPPATADDDAPSTAHEPPPSPAEPGDPSEGATADGEASSTLPGDEVIEIEDARAPAVGSASAREIDQEVIRTTNRRSIDDLLRLVPGLHTSQHGSDGKGLQFFLRGFDAVHGSDLEVRVAGVPVNEAGNVHGQGYVDLGFVMPEVVRTLVAHKGSAVLEQGPFATAGSLDLELGVEERGERIGYEVGSTNRHRVWAVIAPPGQPAASFTAVEGVSDQGYGENRASRRLSATTQQRFDLGEDRSVELFATGHVARFGEPGTTPLADVQRGALPFDGTWDDISSGAVERAIVGVRAAIAADRTRASASAFAGWRRFELSENFTGFLVHADEGDRRRQRHEAITGGIRLGAERDLATGLTAIAAAEGSAERIDQGEVQLDTDGRPWATARSLSGTQLAGAAWAGLRGRLGPLRLEGGGRLDLLHLAATDELTAIRGAETMAVASPRASASYAIAEDVRLFTSYGRGLRPPEARAVTAPETPPPDVDVSELEPRDPHFTTSDALELGAAWRRPRRFALQASAFGIWISDELVFDHVAGTTLAVNSTRRLGVELGVEAWPAPWLRLRGDLSATDARFVDSGEPVPAVPALYGTFELGVAELAGWHAGVDVFYLAPRALAHGATAGDDAVVGLIAGRRLGRFELDLSVDNALDADWRQGEYHYASWFDRSQPRSALPRLHHAAGYPFGVRLSLTANL